MNGTKTQFAMFEALRISGLIRDSIGVDDYFSTSSPVEKEDVSLPLPQTLDQQLQDLGLSHSMATRISEAYVRNSEQFRLSAEETIRTSLAKLISAPRPVDAMPLDMLKKQFINAQRLRYDRTLSQWKMEAVGLARSHLAAKSATSSAGVLEEPANCLRRAKRQFKSEYLPLFEFAFEQDRFPSREDKKHLARISGMSFRQINVWFQNRRSRQPSRAKSHRTTSIPKTFEEMKACLDPSARVALELNPLTKKLNPDLVDPPLTGAPVLMQNPLPSAQGDEVIILDDEDVASPLANTRSISLEAAKVATSLGSNTRSASLEGSETTTPETTMRAVSLGATDDGFASDERDDSSDEEFLATSMSQRSAIVKGRPSLPKKNPLDLYGTPAHAFPTPYAPSQLTSSPFVIEHHPWLRDPRTNSREFVDPAPEAVEEILNGFDHMDVDDPDATVNTIDEQLSKFPRKRIVSTGSSVTWSSEESTAASHTSSYSLSVRSSPQFSDAELASPTESITLETAEYTSSPVAEKSFLPGLEAKTATASPAGDSETAGPSAAAWEEATPLESSIPKDASSADPKWEALLAMTS